MSRCRSASVIHSHAYICIIYTITCLEDVLLDVVEVVQAGRVLAHHDHLFVCNRIEWRERVRVSWAGAQRTLLRICKHIYMYQSTRIMHVHI